jgi:hypothetical protein
MKPVVLVAALLACVPACIPTFYLPASPPQMTTVQVPEAPEAVYVKARQAVAAMGGRLLNHDATARMAFALVPGPVVLHIAVLPDRDGAEVLVTGRARANRPVEDAWRALREYTAFLHQEAARA